MRKRIAIISWLLMFTACVHAQQAKLGGAGGVGGISGWQGSTPPFIVSTTALPDATANVSYSQTLTAVNGVTPYSWTVFLGFLPPGMTLVSSTGVISGTPTTPGSYVFSVLATDSTSPTHLTATQQLSISVDCAPLHILSTSVPSGTQGVPYSFQFQSQGGLGTVAWANPGAGLPTGVTLSSTGLLAGTPTVSGVFPFNVTATDSCPIPQTVTQPFSLQINSPVTITTTSPLPPGTLGSLYQTQMAAQGGISPYAWIATAGSFPPGIAMSTAGVISGTPTATGTFTATIHVTDSGGNSNSGQFTITTSCTPISITSGTTLPAGTQGSPYSFQMQSSGGLGAVTWLLIGGSFANGIGMSTGGLISGIPTSAGSFGPIIQATDSCSPTPQSTSNTFDLEIGTKLTITNATPLPAATEGTPYQQQMVAVGGVPPYTWSVPAGPVPAGAIDLLDYALMPLPDRNNFHLSGTALLKYFRLDGGLFWWMKDTGGFPSDGELYDAQNIYHWFTENGDSVDQPACIAAGFPNCFLDPFAYKRFVNPVPVAPRYFVPGSTVTILTPTVLSSSSTLNPFVRTTNCGADNQPLIFLGNIKTVTSGPTNVSFGGTIGTVPTIEIDYYYSGNVSGVYQNLEKYYLALGFGQAKWEHYNWNGSAFVLAQTSLTNNKVAGGTPTPNFACKIPTLQLAGDLPAGVPLTSSPSLNLRDSTGVISGTPASSGTTVSTIQVEDSVGTIAQGNYQITVSCPVISITSTSPLSNGTQAQPYGFTFTATGGIAPVSWHLIAGALPAGMSLGLNGVLAGTPTNFGTFNFTVQVLDSCSPNSQSDQKPFVLTIVANSGPLTITTPSPLPAGTEGVAYNKQLVATGGTPPYVWAVSSGTPPAGLALSSGGLLLGTPTSAGTTSFTARVTDAIATTTTKLLSTTISCPAFANSSSSPLPTATQGQPYSFQFNSSGGIAPISWSATGVPAGLTLSPVGLLSGTPTTNGSFTINVSASDSCVPTPQTVGPTGFAITIAPPIPPVLISTPSPLSPGTEGVPYGASMAATGGVPPYTWTLASGVFPAGISMNAAGNITGTPTAAGTTSPNIRVTDSALTTTTKLFSFVVSCPAFSVTSGSPLPNATQGQPYSFQFTSAGGIGPISWTGTSIPAGLSLSLAGVLSGTPTGTGTSTPNITATDSCNPTPQAVGPTGFVLTINPAPVPLQITTPSPLPPGTIGQPYSTQLAATGGTAPYAGWVVTAGTLPTGLTLASGAGIISGTPTVVQTTTPTIRVTDNTASTASKAFSITINPASTADNRYCSANETVVNLPQDGVAAPLQKCVNTAMINTPSSGPTKTVCASGCDYTTLQLALNAASCGWIIQIKSTNTGTPAGTQNIYSGTTTLPAKSCTKANWIWIETDQVGSLPQEGSRITPAWTGKASLPGRPAYAQPATAGIYLPKLISTGTSAALTCSTGANFYRLIGLELTTTAGQTPVDVVTCNNADHIIFDRVVVHAGNSANWQDKDSVRRGIDLNGYTYNAVIDSYVGDIHAVGQDAQAILFGGNSASTEGPGKAVDNFLECSGECIFTGGAGAGATNTVPTDLELRRNHLFKPLFWFTKDPSYFGVNFYVKNCMEMKNVNRFMWEGNICDQNWAGQADQKGFMVNLGAKNQSASTGGTANSNGSGTLTAITGTFNANVVSPGCSIPLHCVVKYNGVVYRAATYVSSTVITVTPSPPTLGSGSFTAYVPGLNPNAMVDNGTLRWNYYEHSTNGTAIFTVASDGGDFAKGGAFFTLHDEVYDDIDGFHWSTSTGACCAWSVIYEFVNSATPAQGNIHDILVHHETGLARLSGSAAGFGPGVAFVDQTGAASTIGNLQIYDNIFAAGFRRDVAGVCTNGTDATSVLQCIGAIGGTGPATYCFDHNVLATTTATSGSVTGTGNNPPYPTTAGTTASPNCPFTLTGTALAASYNAIQFTSLNSAINGNYLLQTGSPYHNTASDGTDPGVHWATFQAMIAGVQ